MPHQPPQGGGSQTFRASRLWTSNVWGAAFAGIGAGTLMSIVATIVMLQTSSPKVAVLMAAWIALVLLSALGLFPGHAVEVTVNRSRGLRLRAPFQDLYIPIAHLRDVTPGLHEGFVVRLNRRHGLLTEFLIHNLFGPEGKPLADAIAEEIQLRP